MPSRTPTAVFMPLLVWAMVAGTVFYPALAVLAVAVIADMGLSTTGFGAFLFVYSAVASLASPKAGHLADLLGGRRALALTFALAGAGFIGLYLSSSIWVMAGAAVVVAAGQATMNPSTNKLIAELTDPGSRGVITGVKQSGVYVGYVVTGLVAPVMATTWGWRSYFLLLGGLMLAGGLVSLVLLPPDHAREVTDTEVPQRLPSWVTVLAVYGFVMGIGASAANFLNLFAEVELGYSPQVAGSLASVLGVMAIATRIIGARRTERSGRYRWALAFSAATGVGFAVIAILASSAPSLVWLAVLAFALGLSAWNAIGMLAVIDLAGPVQAGAATGRVLGGYIAGLALGPIAYGWLIDNAGYTAAWTTTALFAAAGLLLMRVWHPPAHAAT